MSWSDFFNQKQTQYLHTFGRGIHADIAKNEEELYTQAYEAFEQKKVLDGYEYFLRSLINYKGEISNDNIILEKTDDSLKFELYQGSAKIYATVTKENLYAEVSVAKTQSASVALKRYILERNYQFTYISYFSDGEFIKLKLFVDNLILSPQKVFYPLRELALNADFDKEHIFSEFSDATLADIEHIKPLNKEELQIKYDFMQHSITELETKVLTLPSNDKDGMQAFLYLNFLFKIDYLIAPNFALYQKISKKVQEYFLDETSSVEMKNEELKLYIMELKELNFEEFSKNFYAAKYTFEQTEKSSFEELSKFIGESFTKIKWYKSNRYNQIIPTIYTYIAFYALYNYGLNNILKALLHLFIEITHSKYFEQLGYKPLYNETTQSFEKRKIISTIDIIIHKEQQKYKNLKPFGNNLNFNSLNEFAYSFYQEIQNLNFDE